MVQETLTDIEAELIAAIRNFHRSYPNGSKELLKYAEELFREAISIKE